MARYRALRDGFMNGVLYGPGRKRKFVNCEKPFPKAKTPSWLVLVETPVAPVQRPAEPEVPLTGTDKLSATIEIGPNVVQISDVVNAAYTLSGKTPKQWNALSQANRDEQIMAALEGLRTRLTEGAPPAELDGGKVDFGITAPGTGADVKVL